MVLKIQSYPKKQYQWNFALDTDRGEGEVDYTSAGLDIDNNVHKYLDDFKLTDDQLVFTCLRTPTAQQLQIYKG